MQRAYSRWRYEQFLDPEDREALETGYISSILPSWTAMPQSFMDVPGELRDIIYDAALNEVPEEVEIQVKAPVGGKAAGAPATQMTAERPSDGGEAETQSGRGVGLDVTIKFTTPQNIQEVGGAFSRECEKRAAHWKTLIMRDSDSYNFEHIILPESVTSVRHAELYLLLFCHSCPVMTHETEGHCRAVSELAKHKSWIDDMLAQLTNLRSLRVFVHLAHDTFVAGKKMKLPCERLVRAKIHELQSLPHVTEVMVYGYKFDGTKSFDGPKDLIMEWRPKKLKETIDRSRLVE